MLRHLILLSVFVASALAVDFSKDIEPLFRARCHACHGAAQQMSGLRLDDRTAAFAGGYSGPVILAGKAAESKLIRRVTGGKDVMIMPPAGKRLTAEEIALLTAWINEGAKWPESASSQQAVSKPKSAHWAFQPIANPAPPLVKNGAWLRNPIDAFVLSRLEKEGVAPSPEAPSLTLLRRVYLDVIGLPPTPAEIADYQADNRPGAYERLVARLLQSPHFGERWARPWLDRARYADSDGYEKDWERPFAWRYRHWVINALNSGMPFDRFTREQIAGDLIPGATPEQLVATGFHRNTLTNREGGIDNNQFRFENTIDRTSTVATTWLGLTMACTQCHDHKYDPLSQRDFYSFFAFFDNIEEVDVDAPMAGELGPYLAKRGEYLAKREELLKEYKVAEQQSAWEKEMLYTVAHLGERTDWDLAWDCLLKLTENGDGEKILRIPADKRTARERDILATHFIRNYHFAVGPKKYEQTKFKELDEKLRKLAAAYPQLTQAMAVLEGSVKPSHLRVRGDYRTLGVEVQPATPAVLPALARPGRQTRLDLANWLVSKENPLTARVAVNWVWAELFGRGLAKAVDDFGTRSEKPSHPELLDYLASRFADDWSFRNLIQQIVTSAAYRQSSQTRPELNDRDPDNALLARQSRLRMTGEQVRDAALTASGLLSREVGGKSVHPPQPAGVTELSYGNRWGVAWPESTGPERYRRGLYIHFQRSTPYPMLMNFDSPKSNVAQCRRDRSNTSLQALNLLNDPVFVEAAQALAYQSDSSAGDFRAKLDAAAARALGRALSDSERSKFQTYFERQKALIAKDEKAAGDLAWSGAGDKAAAAAWVALSTVLLNLDEFITRE